MTAAGRGKLFDEGPAACPFVALDRDRERRADEPDPRHRCYATPTPEPRALAHQRAFCLTANFTGCPIFQDWAVRAAARPVPMRPMPAVRPADDAPVGEPAPPVAVEPDYEASAAEQVSLFDTPIVPAPEAAILPVPEPPMVTAPAPPPVIPPGPVIPPPARPSRPLPVTPASSAPAVQASAARPRGTPTLRKEDIVPAWERSRHDLPGGDRRGARRGRDWFSRLTFLFTALAIVSLAVLVVLLVPILLGSRPPGATASPTQVAGHTGSPSPSPTRSPTPGPTSLTYTVKLGDNLYRIAARFNITYEQLLGANPQITDPNYIRAGDVINIPPPDFVPPSPTFAPPPTASPSP